MRECQKMNRKMMQNRIMPIVPNNTKATARAVTRLTDVAQRRPDGPPHGVGIDARRPALLLPCRGPRGSAIGPTSRRQCLGGRPGGGSCVDPLPEPVEDVGDAGQDADAQFHRDDVRY